MITAKVIKDSIYNGKRLTTLELEYPRYIHSEFMTHRVFSRNAQSSRAIPIDRMISRVEESKWYPIFMKNQSGMTASVPLSFNEEQIAKADWDNAKAEMIRRARVLARSGIHKQIVNRLLEPFSTIKVIVSATEWNNFFRLRIHPAAQQEIQVLATTIRDAMLNSNPDHLDIGEWHLPYLKEDESILELSIQKKLSTARCARVSYLNHDKKLDIDRDEGLHESLLKERHMSPFEHIATPWNNDRTSNFKGWRQYRYDMESLS